MLSCLLVCFILLASTALAQDKPPAAEILPRTERAIFGAHGLIDHVVGLVGFLIIGGMWGALFGLIVTWPTMLKGMAFGLLPTLVHWVVTAPLTGHEMFHGYTATGLGLPLLYYALIWGGVVGLLCGRWLRPPYTADTPPMEAHREDVV